MHIAEELIIPGTHSIDPVAWDPLIMKFCEFFGGGRNVRPSRLATAWRMPHEPRHTESDASDYSLVGATRVATRSSAVSRRTAAGSRPAGYSA